MNAEGFRDDCFDLIKSYVARNSTDFQLFCNEWKLKGFHYVFAGHTFQHELLQYTENCFLALKNLFIVLSTTNERVAALYLMYGLYFKQPIKDFGKFRFTLKDWSDMKSFYNKISTEPKYFQVRTIFWRLWQANAFRFVHCDVEQCFETLQGNRNYYMKVNNFQKINPKILSKFNSIQDKSKGLLSAIETLQLGYNEMKEHLSATIDDCANLNETKIIRETVPMIKKVKNYFEGNFSRDRMRREKELKRKASKQSGNTMDSMVDDCLSLSSSNSESDSESELVVDDHVYDIDGDASSDGGECLNIGTKRFNLKRKAMTKTNVVARPPVLCRRKGKYGEIAQASTDKLNDTQVDQTASADNTSQGQKIQVDSSSGNIVINNPRKQYKRDRSTKNASAVRKQINECPPEVSVEVDVSKPKKRKKS